ncbi:hypothetical protein V495_04266 [Pseudogymnoascus sp. VKM F-4514 (FW-929)]|nr:hypothetical protein V495_04266 [Pseudogymnoascus sp. VKM F-4514 (FW-929)]KFY56952.1 hypothetical protein V497_05867 [Pseudogymnoascus sp. VKM F-4516 (FW-969)]
MQRFCLLGLTVVSVVYGSPEVQKTLATPLVDLGYAQYRGLRLDAGVDQYLGMRYAQPPLGNLRFRAPQDPLPLDGPQNASSFGPLCVGVAQTLSESRGEDCLFVNVFTPSNATRDSKLPVWVYISGGGYAQNSNNNYNGTNIVQQSQSNIVHVNFNYRVGALGFLAGDQIRQDGDLNVGLLDQRKLLRWVQKHIKQFGGDPRHVVLHGTSAGAGSITHHLAAYGGRNDHLFIGAAIQSVFWPPLTTLSERQWQFNRFLNDTGCSDSSRPMNCLRSANLSTIASANVVHAYPGARSQDPLPGWTWVPVIDGSLVPGSLHQQFERGRFIKVPMLVTNCNDEGTAYANDAASPADFSLFLKNNYPNLTEGDIEVLVDAYPLRSPLPTKQAWFPSVAAAYGDATFSCPGHEVALSLSSSYSPWKVWRYRFNMQDPPEIAAGLGVPHAFDTNAIFGPGYAGGYPDSYVGVNAPIVPVTMHYYISFVRSLDPNSHKAPTAPIWEPWGVGTGQQLKLETNSTLMEAVSKNMTERCEVLRSLAGSMRL